MEKIEEVQEQVKEAYAQLEKVRQSIEKCEKDHFPHLPLMAMYKRPPIPPGYC